MVKASAGSCHPRFGKTMSDNKHGEGKSGFPSVKFRPFNNNTCDVAKNHDEGMHGLSLPMLCKTTSDVIENRLEGKSGFPSPKFGPPNQYPARTTVQARTGPH